MIKDIIRQQVEYLGNAHIVVSYFEKQVRQDLNFNVPEEHPVCISNHFPDIRETINPPIFKCISLARIFSLLSIQPLFMTEKVSIKGKEVWIVVEPHLMERSNPNVIPTEYFTASYHVKEPTESPAILFTNEDKSPCLFESPVAALEYANEKLLGLTN
jgi:hypothetical protein